MFHSIFYTLFAIYNIVIIYLFFDLRRALSIYLDFKVKMNPKFNQNKYNISTSDFSITIYPFLIKEKESDEHLIMYRDTYNKKLNFFRKLFIIGILFFIATGILIKKHII